MVDNINQSSTEKNIPSVGQEQTTPISPPLPSDVPKIDNKLLKILIYILASVILLALGALGFWFYQNKLTQQEWALPVQPSVPVPMESPQISEVQENLIFYKHPTLRYTLKYPAIWSQTAPEGVDERYEEDEFAIYSPDYTLGGEGFLDYPKVAKGSMILIIARTTDEQPIDDYFNKEELVLKVIAENKHYEIVDGQSAIQCDWSYEGWEATSTIFIKNGVVYRITLRYADVEEKESNWNVYSALLSSFKAP